MRIANLSGRLSLVSGDAGRGYSALDVAEASGGRFGPDVQGVYDRFDEFRDWASTASPSGARPFEPAGLEAPVPAPRQVFAIGLNYRAHADESGFTAPPSPSVFTKFASSITGPYTEVTLPEGGNVDWEVELVAAIGREAYRVPVDRAWDHVAGLTVGQDLSERVLQLVGSVPQFSLGKSYPGFAPTGPWLVTADEFADPDDLELSCDVDGVGVQKGRTSDLIFSVPALVEQLSAVLPLHPGDLIFTGTPAGVGLGRSPQQFLQDGQVLTSTIEGIGQIRQTMRAAAS